MKILLAIFCFAILVMSLAVIAYYIAEYGKRNLLREKEYDDYYREITDDLYYKPVNPHNYDVIIYKLEKLGQMRWKNREKTSVLTFQFFRKYATEARKRSKENE